MIAWYYSDTHRNRLGPVAAADLADLHAAGGLAPDTLVWREGLADWRPWRELAEEVLATTGGMAPAATFPSMGLEARAVDAGPAASPYAPPTAAIGQRHPVVAGGHVLHARFAKRLASFLVDSLLTAFLGYLVLIPIVLLMGAGAGVLFDGLAAASLGLGFILLMYGIQFFLPATYAGWMQSSRWQATLGKRVAGIKIVRTDGSPIGFWRGFLRSFAYLLSVMLTCGLGAIATLVTVLATERRQALHDMICDTVVVDRHAFTDRADLQDERLDTGTKVVLVLGLLLVVGIFTIAVVAGAMSGASN